jgi:CheY-like chemotaxis protein
MVHKKVLIVEDDADSRDMLAFLLAGRGYHISCAEHGQMALSLIQAEAPELIITDISMPVMDGIDLIKRLRQHPKWHSIPILVMSAFRSGMIAQAMEAGADASATKPLEIEKLFETISQLTRVEPQS